MWTMEQPELRVSHAAGQVGLNTSASLSGPCDGNTRVTPGTLAPIADRTFTESAGKILVVEERLCSAVNAQPTYRRPCTGMSDNPLLAAPGGLSVP
jgi:hypothetical protein